MPAARTPHRDGFTLVELLVVIAIIGILISLILVASAEGVRNAERRQTQALITKLETALTDRVDALQATTAPINQTHRYLAAITFTDKNNFSYPIPGSETRRAQVIAQFDYIKAEMPDVFFVNASFANMYPLNFAAAPYPLNNPNGVRDFALPLGNFVPGLPYQQPSTPANPTYVPTPGFNPATGFNDATTGLIVTPDSGIFGASFTAAAGFYKNLYEAAASDVIRAKPGAVVNARAGYDAADNDGDSLVDNLAEVTVTGNGGATQADFQAAVAARLGRHSHKTARSEALYALLVESQGPLGSVFNREDFTNRDVADTDGDGLPEFIDAWGEPLQFYRWPTYYGPADPNTPSPTGSSSDSQKGYQIYSNTEPRQQDPLDPNQYLVAPGWWSSSTSSNPGLPRMSTGGPDFTTGFGGQASPQANAFMTYFHTIIDPGAVSSPPPAPTAVYNWDRTGTSRRRAFYSKFLVLSGGPDKVPGTFQLGLDYSAIDSTYAPAVAFPTGTLRNDVKLLNWCENQAAQLDYSARGGPFFETVTQTATSAFLQSSAGGDDISNQNLTAPGSGAK